ncbi:MAG: hypothetical protein EOP42_11070 [Sphingobacteriaceae bacterium]|nr:MAG: hypothetical protein EOP42_11070 [Sphingobacteriaceae bacterium]
MEKIFLLIILSGVAFSLKAQQNPVLKPLEKFKFSNPYPLADTNLRINPKSKNDINSLFKPKNNIVPSNLIASLDRMPVLKPVGKWNMPVVHPNGTVVYTMPVKRLPPVIVPEEDQKKNP